MTDEIMQLQMDLDDLEREITELEDQIFSGGGYPGEERVLDDLMADREELIRRIEELEADLPMGGV